MRRLIINADDLGAGAPRDRGIFESFSRGLVTSASLLANGPSFAAAALRAAELGLPIGVHLNLSEGIPLAGAIPGLTTATGAFPGKSALRAFLAGGGVDPAPLYRELAAQIEAVLAAGLAPDHLDTHQHFALFPVAGTLLFELAHAYGIRALRLPSPGEPATADPGGELGAELALYRRLAPAFASALRASGVAAADGLFGMPLLNRINCQTLIATLGSLPEGTWELMVHPGYAAATPPFSGPARQEELVALTAADVAAELHRQRIIPISFRELACAS